MKEFDKIVFFSNDHARENLAKDNRDVFFAIDQHGVVVPYTSTEHTLINANLHLQKNPLTLIGINVEYFGAVNVRTMKKLNVDTPKKLRQFADDIQEIIRQPEYKKYGCKNGLTAMKSQKAGPFAVLAP